MSIITLFILLSACSTPLTTKESHESRFDKAQTYIGQGRMPEAKLLLTDLCERDYGPGCSVLGGLLQVEHKDKYFLFYQKGCDLEDGLGCFGLASIQYKKKENENFEKNIKLSCTYGFMEACRVMEKIKNDNSKAKTE